MLRRIARWTGTGFVFAIAFVINPAYVAGCESTADDGQSSEDKAAIEAELVSELDDLNATRTWTFFQDGSTYKLDLELQRATKAEYNAVARNTEGFMSVAHACGSVKFYQTAAACITVHELMVKGTLTLRRSSPTKATIASGIALHGTVTDVSYANLEFGDSSIYIQDGELQNFDGHNLGPDKLEVVFASQ